MKISNFDALALTPLRRDALMIAEAGLEAIDTKLAVKAGVRLENDTLFISQQHFSLAGAKRVMVAAIGKCAVAASLALEEILGERLSGGIAIDIQTSSELKKIQAFHGTHPMPSVENIEATKALVRMLRQCTEEDFIIFIISGGGSTLLSMPEDVGYKDESRIVKALFKAGATIEELNTVRKHLSLARGGYLAQYAYPAPSVALIFSDVLGNDIQFVASEPTVKDETNIEDAEKIMAEYDVLRVCGLDGCGFFKTPKEDDIFKIVTNILFISNDTALDVMRKKAGELGYNARICDACLSGEAAKIGVRIAKEIGEAYPKTALLYGGETTVTINGDGIGGRNQELALAALPFIKDGTILTSVASDGHDNTDAAGGLCDITASEKAEAMKLSSADFLARNDSYNFWKQIGAQIITHDTGSNVSDLVIALKE